jgi:hypothetical protein
MDPPVRTSQPASALDGVDGTSNPRPPTTKKGKTIAIEQRVEHDIIAFEQRVGHDLIALEQQLPEPPTSVEQYFSDAAATDNYPDGPLRDHPEHERALPPKVLAFDEDGTVIKEGTSNRTLHPSPPIHPSPTPSILPPTWPSRWSTCSSLSLTALCPSWNSPSPSGTR